MSRLPNHRGYRLPLEIVSHSGLIALDLGDNVHPDPWFVTRLFAVGKLPHRVIPASAHGRTKLESRRALQRKHFGRAPMRRREADKDFEREQR